MRVTSTYIPKLYYKIFFFNVRHVMRVRARTRREIPLWYNYIFRLLKVQVGTTEYPRKVRLH